MARLRQDVTAMKRQKVELHQHMTKERKDHLSEVSQLKMLAMKRDREAVKWKQVSEKKKAEAENMQRMAKSHLEEVGKLRSKYREAEKRLRMQTLKRGVMARAGLDPLMVGRSTTRRLSPKTSTASAGSPAKVWRRWSKPSSNGVVISKIRNYFDAKVAEVGQKEAAADKLAHEWEGHLELMSRKEELMKKSDNDIKEKTNEELEALNIQIQYKEGRIRQLSQRLGARVVKSGMSKNKAVIKNSLLEEKEFINICSGMKFVVLIDEPQALPLLLI